MTNPTTTERFEKIADEIWKENATSYVQINNLGIINAITKALATLEEEHRKEVGTTANNVKEALQKDISDAKAEIERLKKSIETEGYKYTALNVAQKRIDDLISWGVRARELLREVYETNDRLPGWDDREVSICNRISKLIASIPSAIKEKK